MRSVFELLINLATTQSGGMSKRVDGVPYLTLDEKRTIKRTWKELCSWGHPYEKWLENICPIYISYKPIMYHPKHFEGCVNLLEKIIDIYLVVSKEYFGMDTDRLREKNKGGLIDFSAFPIFQSRMRDGKKQHRTRIRDPLINQTKESIIS
jgi:hypothetical protein